MRLLISPAAGWKEVQEDLYFLMSNPPRKVNTTDTSRLGSKGDCGSSAYTVVYNVLQLPQAESHTGTGRRHPEVAYTPPARPIGGISLAINKAAQISIRVGEVIRELQELGVCWLDSALLICLGDAYSIPWSSSGLI